MRYTWPAQPVEVDYQGVEELLVKVCGVEQSQEERWHEEEYVDNQAYVSHPHWEHRISGTLKLLI